MRIAAKSTVVIASLALAVGTLTGCSGSSQSVAEACKIITDEGTAVTSKAQENLSNISTDPKAAIAALGDMQTEFEKISDKITNDQVKPAFDKFVGAYGELADGLDSDVDLSDPSKATELISSMTDGMKQVSEAGEALGKICN